MEALKDRFDPSSRHELYLAELLGFKKCRGEDWAAFVEDCGRQLQLSQLAFSVKQRRPRPVDKAVIKTLKMESYLAPRPRSTGDRGTNTSSGYSERAARHHADPSVAGRAADGPM